jgi:hypothetical protein
LEQVRFIFWELLKILGVSFVSLLAVKGVASLRVTESGALASRLARAKLLLYTLVLAIAVFAAWNFGYDIAAEVYFRASASDTQRSHPAKNYLNALQAVQLRPGVLHYWQALESAKFSLGQWASVVEDVPAMRRVAGRDLDEVDSYRGLPLLFRAIRGGLAHHRALDLSEWSLFAAFDPPGAHPDCPEKV